MGIKAHMICHTHWDREWYFTKEEFRIKLIRLIDGLLDIIETVPDYVSFMLDGQTIAIEDYLEIKPYNKERLFKALKSGKIVCGPWYILPDELLISGESHIRNYLKGREILAEAGRQMKIGYLPDSFGHPSQMPQILEGLSLDAMVFWRGTSNLVEHTEFYWESPFSGSKILCIHMPCGYGNSANLSEDMQETLPRIEQLFAELTGRSIVDTVLMMNGSDHIIGQKNINEVVHNLNTQLTDKQIILSTMEEYLKEVKEKVRGKVKDVSVYKGEFRSGQRSMMLGGTLSTRGYLKQENTKAEDLMERYLEPMLCGERLLGGSYDSRGYMDYIWKKILENQPHDSICGCSIDQVHQEMMTRFANLGQLEKQLLSDAAGRIVELSTGEAQTKAAQLFLFEPVSTGGTSYLETVIALDRMLVQEVNFTKSIIEDYEADIDHPALPKSLCIKDETGRTIPYVLLETSKGYDTLYQDHTAPEIYKANEMKILMLLPPMDYGFHMLAIEHTVAEPICFETRQEESVENEYYRVWIEYGTICVLDKKQGRSHHGAVTFIDGGDAGDEYTYSWPKEDEQKIIDFSAASVTVQHAGEICQKLFICGGMKLPMGLNEDRRARSSQIVTCKYTLEIGLYQGIERIDFIMDFDNQAMDHRLQVRFKAGIQTQCSESLNTFDVTKRDVDIVVPEEWMEYPQSTHPTHGFMNIEEEGYGLSVCAKGLNEYESVKWEGETVLNLTLLRCVGWLSRTDLLTRHGNGGWTIETPEAQCIGAQKFTFSLSYHNGSFRSSDVFTRMEKFHYPSYASQTYTWGKETIRKTNPLAFLEPLPKGLVLSAVKPSEDGKGIILRVYHIGRKTAAWSFKLPDAAACAAVTNLAEETIQELDSSGGRIQIDVEPGQIMTLKINIK